MGYAMAFVALQAVLALWVFFHAKDIVAKTGRQFVVGIRPTLWLLISVIPGLGVLFIALYVMLNSSSGYKPVPGQIYIKRNKKIHSKWSIVGGAVALALGVVAFAPKSAERKLNQAYKACAKEFTIASQNIEEQFRAIENLDEYGSLQALYNLELGISSQRAVTLQSCHDLARVSPEKYQDKEMVMSFRAKTKYMVYVYDFYETKARSLALTTYSEIMEGRIDSQSIDAILNFTDNKVLISQELTLLTGQELLNHRRFLSDKAINDIEVIMQKNYEYREFTSLYKVRLTNYMANGQRPRRSISSQQ